MPQDTRTRHMVDISDYAWNKLERLAHRLDAAQFVYKGRQRYGKLLELAIEKLEDSTMEWTVEEVELAQEEWYGDTPEGEETIEWDSKKGWWKGDKLDKYKPSQAAQDMALYGNTYTGVDYGTGGDTTVTLKPIKVKDIQFKVSAHDTATEQLSKIIETLKDLNKSAGAPALAVDEYIAVGKKMEDASLDGITSAIAGKPKPSYVKVFVNQPGYIELTASLTQALSASQQFVLRKFAEAAFAECSNDDGTGALLVFMKNTPWNKLWLSVTYSDPSALVKSLEDVASTVSSKVETWLLQGDFIGPSPQAVDITEKKPDLASIEGKGNYVTGGHKFEKAIDKNGTMQTYHNYNFIVHIDSFEAIGFLGYKNIISEHITTRLLVAHGYVSSNIGGNASVFWSGEGLDKKIHISASVLKNQYKLGNGTVKNFIDEVSGYLMKFVQMVQKPPF